MRSRRTIPSLLCRRLRAVGLLLALLGLACASGPDAPPAPPSPPAARAPEVQILATLPAGSFVDLEWGGDALYAATSDGQVWRMREGAEPELVLPLAEPALAVEAITVAGGQLYLASDKGLLRATDGVVQVIDPEIPSAVAHADHAIYWGSPWWIRTLIGDAVTTVVPDAHILFPGELAASERTLAWVEHGAQVVWAMDRATGERAQLGEAQRRPTGLWADAEGLAWFESDADLLPGRPSRVYRARHGQAGWQLTLVDIEPNGAHVAQGPCLYSPGQWARDKGWQRVDPWGEPPVTRGPERWYWMASRPETQGAEVLSAPLSLCR